MRIVLGLSLVVAMSGCSLFTKAKATTASAPSCTDKPLSQSVDARMPCIMNGDGSSDKIGQQFSFTCKPFEVDKFVYVNGSDPFPLASSICAAAAYVGKLDPANGGPVKIEIVAAQADYPAGEKQAGIKSQHYSASHPVPGFKVVE